MVFLRFLLASAFAALIAVPALVGAAQGQGQSEDGEIFVRGRILLQDGTPAAGTRVELAAIAAPRVESLRKAVLQQSGRRRTEGWDFARATRGTVDRASCNGEGYFLLRASQPGPYRVETRPPGHVPQRHGLLPLLAFVDLPTLTLTSAARHTVVVVDEHRKPLPGALVEGRSLSRSLRPPVDSVGWEPSPALQLTHREGEVQLFFAPGEPARLAAWAPGREDRVVENVLTAETVIQLDPGRPLVLDVSLPGGTLAADTVVTLGAAGWPLGSTEPDGSLRLFVRKDGPTSLRLRHANGHATRLRLASRGPELDRQGVTLEAPRQVSGSIREAGSGGPLSGALLLSRRLPGIWTRADEAGRYRWTLASGDAGEGLVAVAKGYLPSFSPPEANPSDLDFDLIAGAYLEGRVVGNGGEAVSRAEVLALPWNSWPPARTPKAWAHFASSCHRSEADGSFRLGPIPARISLVLRAGADGFLSAKTEVEAPRAGATTSGYRLVLARGTGAFGRILGADEEPVAAKVTLSPVYGWTEGRPAWSLRGQRSAETSPRVVFSPAVPVSTTTGANGRFDLGDLAPGRYDLVATAPGHALGIIRGLEISRHGTTDLGTVLLALQAELEGRVVNSRGHPLAGAWVHSSQRLAVPYEATFFGEVEPPVPVTDDHGYFQVPILAGAAKLDLYVYLRGYQGTDLLGIPVPPRDPVEVVLPETREIHGRVLTPDGRPAAQAWVLLFETSSRTGTAKQRSPHPQLSSRIVDHRDCRDDGTFTLPALGPGRYRIQAKLPGYLASEPRSLEIEEGLPLHQDLENLTLVLRRGETLEGQVLDDAGAPVAGVGIEVTEAEAVRSRREPQGRTGLDGKFRVTGLPQSTVDVRADVRAATETYLPATRRLELRPGPNWVEIRLRAGAEVSGRVVDPTGAPVAEASVRLRGREGASGGRATSGTDGTFHITPVADGQYLLTAQHRDFAPATAPETVVVEGRPTDGLEVKLHPGGVIAGEILGLEPGAVASLDVIATLGDETLGAPAEAVALGTVGWDGRYEVAPVGPGVWTVLAVHRGDRRSVRETVSVPAGVVETLLDLEFAAAEAPLR